MKKLVSFPTVPELFYYDTIKDKDIILNTDCSRQVLQSYSEDKEIIHHSGVVGTTFVLLRIRSMFCAMFATQQGVLLRGT